jgi:hypothetical protein
MARQYVFADEAGCLTFAKQNGVSRYFILCTVAMDCKVGHEVLDLRREMAWRGLHLEADQFHCTTDPEVVRNEMFDFIASRKLRIDATVLEKSKAAPAIRPTDHRFYQYAWYYHFKFVGPQLAKKGDELLIQAASIGTKKKRQAFLSSINDVAQQTLRGVSWKCTFWSASSDPCLQIADYCAWAIQRALESGDSRRREQIKAHIRTQYDLFERSSTHHY